MLKIVKDGLLTSIQDLGRTGYQKYGVISSGSMDTYAHRIANVLVGNEEQEATVEVTLLGPEIKFEEDALLSICGGDLSPKVNNQNVSMWKPVYIERGSTLKFGKPKSGCRAYLAIAGGLDIPEVMGSRSTYLRAELGGFKGRALSSGDEIAFRSALSDERKKSLSGKGFIESRWMVAKDIIPDYSSRPVVSIIDGPQYDWFDKNSQESLFKESFKVSSQSDRMGYRLNGPSLSLKKKKELISEAVAFGSIQVPPDGNPIILLADRQTTGGYPKIGQAASVELPVISQIKPGEQISFKRITLEDAQRALLKQEQDIHILKRSISNKSKEE
ncbi:biotin-dependent carboxyltransferase family protein [Halobacillus sp. Marseille-Q1614]|uniref:5-oxoprolinase subunit C family protein n=1 Tax=Halobacillus sp. Marseille-Q1614 TaxID=2709134 RepID=UPI00156E2A2D|nr:biotin-dependent carboxyltransferase family protein [Halobacillus sp. Marseille-Q1614]